MPSMIDTALLDRHTRAPKHNAFVEAQMWEITPFLLAPVLPGETLSGLTLQSRVVTPPIKSRVVGWWLEYYIFYVPFRQMPDAANLVAMFVDPTVTLSATAASARSYYGGLGYDFASQCLQVVTQEWFRREGENWSSFTIRANRPAASHGIDNFMESMIDNTVLTDGGVLGATSLSSLERNLAVTEYRRKLREMGSDGGQVDYEEVLASYGASIKKASARDRPELIRYIREWQYPTNTVEPTTGTPTTAVSWAVNDRADKRRAFTEPGFIFGVQVVRPKVYFSNQTGNASVLLDRAQRWLPPMMETMEGFEVALAESPTANSGPFGKAAGGFTNGYWLDVRDLFNYGDQWLDVATPATANAIALPSAGAASYRYGTSALADTLLGTAGALTYADINCQLRVKTRTVERS